MDELAGAEESGGREVESVPTVMVDTTELGGALETDAGTGMAEVAEGRGEENEPCIWSSLRDVCGLLGERDEKEGTETYLKEGENARYGLVPLTLKVVDIKLM